MIFNTSIINLKEKFEKSKPIDLQTASKVEYLNRQIDKFEELQNGFELVFIGTKAAGKSTVINSILGKIFNNPDDNSSKLIEVLKTGAGATTACPMNIVPSDDQKIRVTVTPISQEDLEDLFIAFAYNMFRLAKKDINKLKNYNFDISPEMMNLLRTVTKTKKKKKDKTELTKLTNIDPAIELASKYTEEEFISFVNELKSRAMLEKRTKLTFICEDSNTYQQAIWLKKTINELNSCSKEEASIPKEIILQIPQQLFNFSSLKFITNLKDSRGYDNNNNILGREDFVEIFSKNKNQFIIIVEDFDKAPNKQTIDLLRQYAHSNDLDLINRMIFLCNYRSGQPLKVNVGDEVAETIEEGCDERKEQILLAFSQNDIVFNEENIIFFNPNEEVENINAESLSQSAILSLKSQQNIIIKNINSAISTHINACNDELLELKNQIDNLSNTHINDTALKILGDLQGFIKEYLQHPTYLSEDSLKNLISSELQVINPSVLNAFNRRKGYYNGESIFRLLSINISSAAKNYLVDLKKLLNTKLETHLQNYILPEKILKNINQIEHQVVDTIQNAINTVLQRQNDILSLKIYSLDEEIFWSNCVNRYGQGTGYRTDIITYYQKQILEIYSNTDINIIIKEVFENLDKHCNNLVLESLEIKS